MKNTQSHIIQQVKAKDPTILKWLYQEHRDAFVNWASKLFTIEGEEALDTFQEAVIVFYQNIAEGKLTELNCTVKTYLFSVGRNILLKKHRNQLPLTDIEEANYEVSTDVHVLDDIELNHRQQLLAQALEELGEKCRQLLRMAFYREFDPETIAEELGYSNSNVVKTSKMRCLKQLKNIFAERYKGEF